MICGNGFAHQWCAELEAAAHVPTAGVRVVILHPKYRGSCSQPVYRNGTVRLPACLFDGTMDWGRTWRHELQHAVDDRAGLLWTMTTDEAEARAGAAERSLP